MKLRKIRCPHCEEVVELDFDVGLKQECPECDEPIVLSTGKTVVRRRRSGVKVGGYLHGTLLRENEDAPPTRRRRKKRSSSKSRRASSHRPVEPSYGEELEHIEVREDEELAFGGGLSGRSRKSRRRPGLSRKVLYGVLGLVTVGAIAGLASYLKRANEEESRGPIKINAGDTPTETRTRKDIAFDRLAAPLQNTPHEKLQGSSNSLAISEDLRSIGFPEEAGERIAQAREAVIQFLEAATMDERLPLIRELPVLSSAISKYYAGRDPGPIEYAAVSQMGVEDKDPRYVAFSVQFPDGTDRMIGLEFTAEGYKIDWPSFVVYSEMDWNEFMVKKPKLDKRFRVEARPSDYYNYGFTEEEYASYELSNPIGFQRSLYGFVRRGSTTHTEMVDLSRKIPTGRPMPLVLDIGFPADARADNLVIIKRMVSNGWFVRDAGNRAKASGDALRGDL